MLDISFAQIYYFTQFLLLEKYSFCRLLEEGPVF